jgi:23S rRNA (cytidine1920-2'-O)/16S rRNA (cytidine1409-2'-O)-methyltransferase
MKKAPRKLIDLIGERQLLEDPGVEIEAGRVMVDGRVVMNPASLVRPGASVTVVPARQLRGKAKLGAALSAFGVDVHNRTALDVGAAAGGFTQALLAAGARKVYALDAGHGQLIGSLRQDPRVVNLEGVNLGIVDSNLVPEVIDLVTIDVSYLSLSSALGQLGRLRLASRAILIGLVKPMFELRLGRAPMDVASLNVAIRSATAGAEVAGWTVVQSVPSPMGGSKGAIEGFILAKLLTKSSQV